MQDQLREKMAGEIALSEEPGRTIRKWREEFCVSQLQLARHLGVSPSVISDYESGRRRSPGIVIVRRIVDGMIALDTEKGSPTLRKYDIGKRAECIISMREFKKAVPAEEFIEIIEGRNRTSNLSMERDIHGFTALDSLKTITSLSSIDYLQIYGWSSERAFIFTDVHYGRSPMIAIRAHPLKPAMVVYHRPGKVDPLAVRLALLEEVLLVTTAMDMNEIITRLKER